MSSKTLQSPATVWPWMRRTEMSTWPGKPGGLSAVRRSSVASRSDAPLKPRVSYGGARGSEQSTGMFPGCCLCPPEVPDTPEVLLELETAAYALHS